jgi:hypothetical protein
MKSSRLRGAALAWGAILASGTVYSQVPYSGPNSYSYSQPYYQAAPQQPFYPAPQQSFYQPAPQQPYYQAAPQSYFPLPSAHLPTTGQTSAVPVNLAGQINYAAFPRGNGHAPQTSLVSNAPMSILATPVQSQPNTGPVGVPPGGEIIGPGLAPSGAPMVAPQMQGQPTQQGQFPGQNYYYGYGQSPNAGAANFGAGANGLGYSIPYGAGSGIGYGGGYDNGYGCSDLSCGTCAPCCQPSWYVGLYGMWLTRDNYPNSTFSFDSSNEAVQFTNARDTNPDWDGGLALTVGHCFNCGCNALEFVYWGWYPDDAATFTYASQLNGQLNGIFNWDSLTYNGQTCDVWVDNALVHGLWRETEVNNFELNVLRFGGGGCGPFSYSILGGSRIFVYEDALMFGSDTTDNTFDGDASELYYRIGVRNKLYGFQIGGVGTYSATQRLAFNAGTKFGVFLNKISHQSTIGGANGLAVINNGPFTGQPWNVSSDKDDVSFLTEIFLGASYCITPRWSLSAGYRAIAITGIAEPTDQIYPDLRGINDVASIESDGSMILHGAYFGAQFCW